MDPFDIENLHAMKKNKNNQFLNNLILYSFIAMTCSLFCYNPFWFPSVCSSMKFFLLVSLPNIGSLFFNPKCLFIVCNIIVVFLVGESRLGGSKTSPATEIYEEYVKRTGSLHQRLPTVEEKKEKEKKLELSLSEESENKWVDKEKGEAEVERVGGENEKVNLDGEEENVKDDSDEEEELGLPAEEINKRVEDFIAKIIKERRLEARLLMHEKGQK